MDINPMSSNRPAMESWRHGVQHFPWLIPVVSNTTEENHNNHNKPSVALYISRWSVVDEVYTTERLLISDLWLSTLLLYAEPHTQQQRQPVIIFAVPP